MRKRETEVLVVGAGPVGLLTALLLVEAGIQVQIIDLESGPAARSYACALHPASIQLLARLGLADSLMHSGRRVSRMAFYQGETRHAELNFASLPGDFPFVLVLPQSALESILAQRLRQQSSVAVQWNHRFDDLQSDGDTVLATIEQFEGTAVGYIVPHWESVVRSRFELRAQFVVGADGHNSLVRRRIQAEREYAGPSQGFIACEFCSESVPRIDEMRVVLDETSAAVLWPLPSNGYRWSFELVHPDPSVGFPDKDRHTHLFADLAINEQLRGNLSKLIQRRAPWFSAEIDGISWCKQVIFEPCLAERFGQDRCWLAGDAGHQTGPIGVQSMNIGLLEAQDLASRLQKILRADAPLESLANYEADRRAQWRPLLGLTGRLKPRPGSRPWVCPRAARILPCLPASGPDLTALAGQLELDFS